MPDTQFTPIEARVIGSLIEKQVTTPDVYPLTANALVNACNQKTSRDPVMNLSAGEVGYTLRQLAERGLVRPASGGGRADRWEHRVDHALNITPPERVLLGLLLLRGPQTASELMTRSARMHAFDTDTLQATLDQLKEKEYVTRLERQSGQREARYAHRMSGDPQTPRTYTREPNRDDLIARIEALETRVYELEKKQPLFSGKD